MKIVKLIAENIKRLVAVEITPDGNVVQITGKNSQGKTSVLDSIWWALSGASNIQAAPIRKGANKARIKLDLGELIVTRSFNKGKAGGATTSITVENSDGKKMPSPQTILNGLIGELSFDPLSFSRMKAPEQLEYLRRFVPGVDFGEIEKQNASEFTDRAEINRRAKRSRAMVDEISVPKDLPDDLIDESALVDELQKAGEHNAQIEKRKARRDQAQADVQNKLAEGKRLHDRASELKKEAENLLGTSEDNQKYAAAVEQEAAAITKKLAEAEPLPAPIDPADLRAKIETARTTNANISKAKQKAGYLEEARKLEEQSQSLTTSMENREGRKRLSIENAKMPIEGLSLGDGEVFFNGIPFDQASDSDRLRVSVSIAMASNPKLRVIRVRDGSLLDEDAMKLLAEMADTSDYQIWIERVDGTGKTGIILEDGMVKEAMANV